MKHPVCKSAFVNQGLLKNYHNLIETRSHDIHFNLNILNNVALNHGNEGNKVIKD